MSPPKRSKIVYSTPTSLSLEKLMLEEMDYSSSDFNNTSGGVSSRSSLSAQDSSGEEKLKPPWSFEGEERKSPRRMMSRSRSKAAKLKPTTDSPPPPSPPPNVGRCVAGCAGDCTALCCCPFTVFYILADLCYKLPVSVLRRVSKAVKSRRRGSSPSNLSAAKLRSSLCSEDYESWSAPPSVTDCHSDPSSPLSLPSSIQLRSGFGGQHLWKEFDTTP